MNTLNSYHLFPLGTAFAQTFSNKIANVIILQFGPIGAFWDTFLSQFIK